MLAHLGQRSEVDEAGKILLRFQGWTLFRGLLHYTKQCLFRRCDLLNRLRGTKIPAVVVELCADSLDVAPV